MINKAIIFHLVQRLQNGISENFHRMIALVIYAFSEKL